MKIHERISSDRHFHLWTGATNLSFVPSMGFWKCYRRSICRRWQLATATNWIVEFLLWKWFTHDIAHLFYCSRERKILMEWNCNVSASCSRKICFENHWVQRLFELDLNAAIFAEVTELSRKKNNVSFRQINVLVDSEAEKPNDKFKF